MKLLTTMIRRLVFSPRRVAVVDDQRSWRAIELYVAALHLARAIERTTDRPHVGVMLPTSGLFPVATLATWMLGRTLVPLNYLLKPDELAYVIGDAELDTVVTVGPMLEHFGDLPEGVTALKMDAMSFKGFPPLRRAARRPDDALAVLLYTSGTSGRPKGVMLSAGNLQANVRQCIDWVGFGRDDVLLGVLPQFHTFGLTVLTLLPMAAGCKVVYTARYNPRKLLKLMETHRPTAFIAIPSMHNGLLSAKTATADHFRSIKYLVSGGEALPEAVFNGFRERFEATINEGYGLTETAPVTNWCRPQEYRPKSVGPAVHGVEEKIVDPDGRRLGTDEEGEICIKVRT